VNFGILATKEKPIGPIERLKLLEKNGQHLPHYEDF
jgi:hypothetical protein